MLPWMRRVGMGLLATGLIGATVATAQAPSKVTSGTGAGRAAESESAPDLAAKYPPPKWVTESATLKPGKKPATRPVPGVERVMIISIDGCRPDLLLRADTPNLRKLFSNGAYSFWAKTTPNSITLPSHVSMLTGVDPRKHGIEWNSDLPLLVPFYPRVPSIFYHAKKAGYTTAMVAGKVKFNMLEVQGTLDASAIPEKTAKSDDDLAAVAADIILKVKPELMFVHLPGTDSAGHKYKWGSQEQMKAIESADAAIARVLAAAEEAGTLKGTVVIISADHGGMGNGHGPDDARARHIPWIASGPGVRSNLDLASFDDLQIRTEDTFATACWLLNIPHGKVDGTPVERAFKLPAKELLSETPKK